ncbi:hypothetical protein CEXT_618831 [Caerostris extrusa]|uniref:Uncharacterized protein n=1 Tax=Caerostris extrusa TaxID=172846 RepID=A0AAV4X2K4_CAEEX|nr:hypothetical protein CEXT_618831 [Caerostris extrusa]
MLIIPFLRLKFNKRSNLILKRKERMEKEKGMSSLPTVIFIEQKTETWFESVKCHCKTEHRIDILVTQINNVDLHLHFYMYGIMNLNGSGVRLSLKSAGGGF